MKMYQPPKYDYIFLGSSRIPLHSVNTHNDKVLCLDWSIDNVSSYVGIIISVVKLVILLTYIHMSCLQVLASGSADNTLRTYTVT